MSWGEIFLFYEYHMNIWQIHADPTLYMSYDFIYNKPQLGFNVL